MESCLAEPLAPAALPVTGSTSTEPGAGPGTGSTGIEPGALTTLVEPIGPDLAAIEEPVDLLHDLRVLATERPALARAEAPRRLAALATPAWSDPLARCGEPTAVIGPAFQAATREIWLWVEGDRNWGQLGSHLAGRVARRVSCSAPAGLP